MNIFFVKCSISNQIENIFIGFILKTKPITVGTIYRPLDQLRFLTTLSDSLNTINILIEEQHILGDLNFNLCENDTLVRENKKEGTNKISAED